MRWASRSQATTAAAEYKWWPARNSRAATASESAEHGHEPAAAGDATAAITDTAVAGQ